MDFEFVPVPPEVKEQLERQMDQQQMAAEAARHEIQHFLESLNMEQVKVLRNIFHQVANYESGMQYSSYLEGILAATLQHKYGVCGGCGKDHDKELMEAASRDLSDPDGKLVVDDGTEQMTLPFTPDQSVSASDEAEYLKLCETYNVAPSEDKGGVTCKNCGLKYVSLGDRMVKPPGPENCEGCIHKAKWG